ncbi:MAG: hypothetical protein DCF25_17690 [Leptolyngbya foveolarum]|uniref:SLH domain-containing protein n=1 Tax=Leptolyngbya foveolarum TaxID=47253 RepID=A0A2W4W024_9CYAN|nr:MAG: hypothetical protein DCF25_17690 [Leptolyngbya foveolarum]
MTQSPIEPPNNPDRRPEETPGGASSNRPLGFDEMVAVLVAFLSLGSVLFWGLTRGSADSIFSEPLASGRAGVEEVRPPIAFGSGDDSEGVNSGVVAVPRRADEDSVRPSARAELAERAALRRERVDVVGREPTGSVWSDFRAGTAGTAAGVAGVAATSGEAEALPETEAAAEAVKPKASEAASAPAKDPIGFADVPDTYWAKPFIDGLSSRGLISGFDSGDFRPDEQVTRAQVANIVSRTFGLTANKENLEFSDVAGDYWARESIGEVVRGGFMTGFPGDVFKPNEPVTRAQALTTLVTGLDIKPPNNVQPTLSRYTDANSIPKWATEKVAAATTASLVVNYPKLNQINAAQPTTRAELSAMIYQALAEEGIVEPVESQYVVKP